MTTGSFPISVSRLADLNLVQVGRFVAVVEHGGFTAAARYLNMTQQTLSASIAKLEETAGARLLERKRGSTVELTPFGRLMLERAQHQLALSNRLTREISSLRAAHGDYVVVGIGETMTSEAVARTVAHFNRERPEIQLRVVEDYTERLLPRLVADEIDFVIGCPSFTVEAPSALTTHRLFEVEDVLTVRSCHPLVGRPSIGLADLAAFPWIVAGARNDDFSDIQLVYAEAGLSAPRVILRSDATAFGLWILLEHDYIICGPPDRAGVLVRHGLMAVLPHAGIGRKRQACLFTRTAGTVTAAAAALLGAIVADACAEAAATSA